MTRHQKFGGRETCNDCGETNAVTVTVDTWSGQAAYRCPECDAVQEPEGGRYE